MMHKRSHPACASGISFVATYFAAMLAVLTLVGCGPTSTPPPALPSAPAPTADVDVLQLSTMPTAVNVDVDPDMDAVQAQVFCYKNGQDQPVTITGTLGFTMFDGTLKQSSTPGYPPLKTWSYDGRQLKPQLSTYRVWGYNFYLIWDKRNQPKSGFVTIVATYKPPGSDKEIFSDPVTVPVGGAP